MPNTVSGMDVACLSLLWLLTWGCVAAHAEKFGRKLLESDPSSAVENTLTISADDVAAATTTGIKSALKCQEYSKAVYTYLPDGSKSDNCPKVTEPLVTKGKNAVPREFPHMAMIGYGTNKSSIAWWCGGSLISERFVLSAAHCTDAGKKKGLARWVRLGEYNRMSTLDEVRGQAQVEDYEIVERINHPNYTGTGLRYNDIALYRLERDVRFNEFIRPACLNTNYLILQTDAIITGWGHTAWGGEFSHILQKAKVPIVPIATCRNDWFITVTYKYNNTGGIRENTQICAGNTTEGIDTCQGDSGGPLQVSLDDTYHCMFGVIGVTSFGTRCGGNEPSLYSRVSHYVPWIEKIVWS